jgi:hypothetical protein
MGIKTVVYPKESLKFSEKVRLKDRSIKINIKILFMMIFSSVNINLLYHM